MSRRLGRKKALQALFGIEVGDTDKDIMLARVLENVKISETGKEFSRNLIDGVLANKAKIDELIVHYSKLWDIKRIGRVELCVLRIAIFEMLYVEDIPPAVSINEAVELGRDFAGDNSVKFINGVLDMVNKDKSRSL